MEVKKVAIANSVEREMVPFSRNGKGPAIVEGPLSTWGFITSIEELIESQRRAGAFRKAEGFCRIEFSIDTPAIGPDGDPSFERQLIRAEFAFNRGVALVESSKAILRDRGEHLSDPARKIHKIEDYTLDPKGRITIPKKFSSRLPDPDEVWVVITSGPGGTLLVFEEAAWQKWYDQKSGEASFLEDYGVRRQAERKIQLRTGRVQIITDLLRYAKVRPGQDIRLYELAGYEDVMLLLVPTAQLDEKRRSGELSFIVQKLLFDLSGYLDKV